MVAKAPMGNRHTTTKRGNCECITTWGRRTTPALSCFNYDTMPSLKNLSIAVLARFCCWYITLHCDLDLWPYDLEHLQRIACDVMKLYTKFERNRAIRGWVIAISVFDLMTLNTALRVALGSGIIFTKSDLRQLICVWIIAFFWCWYVMSRCNPDLWPLDLELLHHFGCPVFVNSVHNLSKIE